MMPSSNLGKGAPFDVIARGLGRVGLCSYLLRKDTEI